MNLNSYGSSGDNNNNEANLALLYPNLLSASSGTPSNNPSFGYGVNTINDLSSIVMDGSGMNAGNFASNGCPPSNDLDSMLLQLQQQQQRLQASDDSSGIIADFSQQTGLLPADASANNNNNATNAPYINYSSDFSSFLNSKSSVDNNLQQTQIIMDLLQQQQQQQPNNLFGMVGGEGLLTALSAASSTNTQTTNVQNQTSMKNMDGSAESLTHLNMQQFLFQRPTGIQNQTSGVQGLPQGLSSVFDANSRSTGLISGRLNPQNALGNGDPFVQAPSSLQAANMSNDTRQLELQLAMLQQQLLGVQQQQLQTQQNQLSLVQQQQQHLPDMSVNPSSNDAMLQQLLQQNFANPNFLQQQQLFLQQQLSQNSANMVPLQVVQGMPTKGNLPLQSDMVMDQSEAPMTLVGGQIAVNGMAPENINPMDAEASMSQSIGVFPNSAGIAPNMISQLQQVQLSPPPHRNILQGQMGALSTSDMLNDATVSLSGTSDDIVKSTKKRKNSTAGASSKRKRKQTFPEKLMQAMIEYGNEETVAWLPDGKSFVVVSPDKFCDEVLQKAFKEAKYASFVRKLHRWGFVRLTSGTGTDCFHHPQFQKNGKELAGTIHCVPRGDDKNSHDNAAGATSSGMDSKPPSLAGVEKFIKGTVSAAAISSETEKSRF